MAASEKVRLDKYLWAIRIFKTRTLATSAIDEGKVKLAGIAVKPSRAVALGDRYEIRTPARKWTIEVTGILQNRQGFEEAIKHYADLSTEEDLAFGQRHAPAFYTGKRLSKTGRPTKKERRGLSGLLGDEGEGGPSAE